MQEAPGRSDEDEALRGEADRIAGLLGELEVTAGPLVWPRVKELVERVLHLYGEALARIVGHTSSPEVTERLAADELVASVLLLHGLHPLSATERIRRALATLGPLLEAHGGKAELLGVAEAGTVHLRLEGTWDVTGATLESALKRALTEAAPEVGGVEIEGLPARAPTDRLVQIGQPRRTAEEAP